ncbi:hypothetical protein HMPREF3192_01454 [Atopobium deltae]|uniref:Uncharacterized protein n=1 Tax=Atopobium deltae TaxID=1393034 RepID=A0A133XQ70_9ACTN|nr:hypothetical protein HMPREF3192_01454 [Atopobium deltae]
MPHCGLCIACRRARDARCKIVQSMCALIVGIHQAKDSSNDSAVFSTDLIG